MSMPLLSIVVPTHNRALWLCEALETLVCQRTDGKFSYEILVVDNASTDTTATVVELLACGAPAPIRYFYQTTPGDAPTRNLGVRNARGAWIAFFDDDQFARCDWLLQLYETARQQDADVVGGAVQLDLSPEESGRLGRFCREALREIDYYDKIQPYTGKHLPGCGNALVSRRVFDALGAFDEAMINGGSDSDFFLRARAAGYPLLYTPHAVIRHRVPAERLTREYLRWDALQGAENVAHLEHQRHGSAKTSLLAIARAGQAALVHVPLLAAAWCRGDQGGVLGRKVRLWRAEGYLRRALSLIAPRLFPQRNFLESLNFHKGFRQQNSKA
jgi:GT2 family glycosyltransferase